MAIYIEMPVSENGTSRALGEIKLRTVFAWS
jgi:hypothetical protein